MNRRNFLKYFLFSLGLFIIKFPISKKINKKNKNKFIVSNWNLKSEDLI